MKSEMEFPRLYTGSLINVANLSIIPENPENMTVLRNLRMLTVSFVQITIAKC